MRGNHAISAETEARHPYASGLDERPSDEIAGILLSAQAEAAASVARAQDAIAAAAARMAQAIREGCRLYYCAAGSSGLMGAADALELGGTFGIPADQVRIVMAGGMPTSAEMPGETEDATTELDEALAALTPGDVVIAVSASGSTPFTCAAAKLAQRKGAVVIGVANTQEAPLFASSDMRIHLSTPPEVLSGSTRLGAGTAQKIALNTMSTLMALDLGHIHDGMMVNMRADNAKLRGRAKRMVSTIAEVEEDAASKALDAAGGDVKTATLLAAGAMDVSLAAALLDACDGRLRPALVAIRKDPKAHKTTR